MVLRQGLRTWLLAKESDPSVRLRVLRDLLDRPADDPAVVGAQREIGRKGWAAQILRGQHPSGQWVNPGTSALDLYRPKYVATNWRLLVLSDLGLTKKTPPGRESDGPVPEPLLADRRSRRPQQRSVHHRERGPHDGPIRVLEGPSDETGNRMARSPPEEGWRLALLPLSHRDARLLGGPRR